MWALKSWSGSSRSDKALRSRAIAASLVGEEQRDCQSLQRSPYLKELPDLGGGQAVHP